MGEAREDSSPTPKGPLPPPPDGRDGAVRVRRYFGHHFKHQAPVLSGSKLFSGFYNLLFICLGTYIVSYSAKLYFETGRFSRGWVWESATAQLDSVLYAFLAGCCVAMLEYAAVRLIVLGCPWFLCVVLHVVNVILQLGIPFYTCFCAKLNPSQSAFLAIEGLLLAAKGHSYFVVNHHLKRLHKYYDNASEDSEDTDSATGTPEFPNSVNLSHFLYFMLAPVLVYETRYPMASRLRFGYILERLLGFIVLMATDVVILEGSVLPVLQIMDSRPFWQSYLSLVFPTMGFYLATLFLVFEYILPLIAECTFFADRFFYDDWWNASNMAEFAKKWNRPVYKFLVRHVFFSSVGYLPKGFAIGISFLVNCLVDEVVLFAVFRQPSVWFLMLLLFEVPPLLFGFVRHHAVKNFMFLAGLSFGLPLGVLQHARAYMEQTGLGAAVRVAA